VVNKQKIKQDSTASVQALAQIKQTFILIWVHAQTDPKSNKANIAHSQFQYDFL